MKPCLQGVLVISSLAVLSPSARASETHQSVKRTGSPRSGRAPVDDAAATRARNKVLKQLGDENPGALSEVFGRPAETERGRKGDSRASSGPAPAYKAEIVEVAAHDERGYLVRSSLDLQVEQKLPEFAQCFAAAMKRGELTMGYGWTDWWLTLRRDGTLQPSGSSSGDHSPALLRCFQSVLPRLMSKADVERILVPHDRPFHEIGMNVKLRFR